MKIRILNFIDKIFSLKSSQTKEKSINAFEEVGQNAPENPNMMKVKI